MMANFVSGVAPFTLTRSTLVLSAGVMAAPWASWMCPKMCSLHWLSSPLFRRAARAGHPACFPFFERSHMPCGGVWVRRISVVDGIRAWIVSPSADPPMY